MIKIEIIIKIISTVLAKLGRRGSLVLALVGAMFLSVGAVAAVNEVRSAGRRRAEREQVCAP
jgi:hypothetical protein